MKQKTTVNQKGSSAAKNHYLKRLTKLKPAGKINQGKEKSQSSIWDEENEMLLHVSGMIIFMLI